MTEKLLGFLFLGILLAISYHLGIGLIYSRFFPASPQFLAYWYVPQAAVPALLLGGLAWLLGFYRKLGWAELVVTLILVAIVGLTVPASYAAPAPPARLVGLAVFEAKSGLLRDLGPLPSHRLTAMLAGDDNKVLGCYHPRAL